MKNLLLFISLIVATDCSKHKDPGFTSVEGKWTYSTPDNEVSVTFELVKNSSGGLGIQNQTIKIDGTLYVSAFQITALTSTSIQKIRVNANDAKAIFPYNIEFNNGTVSGDYKTITFSSATYTWPWPTVNSLSMVNVTRP